MQNLLFSFLLLWATGALAQVQDSLLSKADSLWQDMQADPGTARTLITAADILERGYDNVDELINAIPGMYLTHDRNRSQIGIRGASPTENNNQRILILLDHIPLNNPLTGEVPSGYELQGLAPEDIAEVVVIRNPDAVRYGNNALLGVIHIKTKRAQKGLRLTFDTGSPGELDGGLSLGQQWGNTAFRLSGRYATMDGEQVYFPEFIQTDDSLFSDRGISQQLGRTELGGTQLQLTHRGFALHAAYNWRKGELDFSQTPFGIGPNIQRLEELGSFREQQLFSSMSYEGPVGPRQGVRARLYFNFSRAERNSAFEYLDFGGMDSFIEEAETHERKSIWMGADYRHFFQLTGGHQLMVGTEAAVVPRAELFAKYQLKNYGIPIGGDSLRLRRSFWSWSLFALQSYRFSAHFVVEAGLRLNLNASSQAQFAPHFSARFQPTATTTLRLAYSQGYRLPTLAETEFTSPNPLHPLPSAGLLPEKSHNLELGLQQQLGQGLELQLALYRLYLSQLIDYHSPYANLGPKTFAGLEGGLAVDLPAGMKSYLNYNFSFRQDSMVNQPRPLCKFGLSFPFLRHFSFYTEGQYEGGRRSQKGVYTQPFFLINTNLLLRPQTRAKGLWGRLLNQSSLSFRVFNVLDQFYQHPAGRELAVERVTQNGRSWQSQLTLQF